MGLELGQKKAWLGLAGLGLELGARVRAGGARAWLGLAGLELELGPGFGLGELELG